MFLILKSKSISQINVKCITYFTFSHLLKFLFDNGAELTFDLKPFWSAFKNPFKSFLILLKPQCGVRVQSEHKFFGIFEVSIKSKYTNAGGDAHK